MTDMLNETNWVVVRTKPNSEQIAIRNIKNQRFEFYFPKIKEQKIKRGEKIMVEQALFPGYLFVKIEGLRHWTSLKYTYGVHSVIMSSQSSPAWVSEAILEDLRGREDETGFIVLPQPNRLAEGDIATIKSGPFQGQKGLVERMPQKARQQVLMNLLSGAIRVLVAEEDLEPPRSSR